MCPVVQLEKDVLLEGLATQPTLVRCVACMLTQVSLQVPVSRERLAAVLTHTWLVVVVDLLVSETQCATPLTQLFSVSQLPNKLVGVGTNKIFLLHFLKEALISSNNKSS